MKKIVLSVVAVATLSTGLSASTAWPCDVVKELFGEPRYSNCMCMNGEKEYCNKKHAVNVEKQEIVSSNLYKLLKSKRNQIGEKRITAAKTLLKHIDSNTKTNMANHIVDVTNKISDVGGYDGDNSVQNFKIYFEQFEQQTLKNFPSPKVQIKNISTKDYAVTVDETWQSIGSSLMLSNKSSEQRIEEALLLYSANSEATELGFESVLYGFLGVYLRGKEIEKPVWLNSNKNGFETSHMYERIMLLMAEDLGKNNSDMLIAYKKIQQKHKKILNQKNNEAYLQTLSFIQALLDEVK